MKVAEWKRLVRAALPSDQGHAFREQLCYATPVGQVLFGIAMDTSRDPQFIYIARIAMPLFVPTHTIHGGVRAVGDESERISIERDDIARIVSNVWASQKSEKWELKHLVRDGDGSKNRLRAEAAAYAALLLGRRRLGLRILRTALHAPSDDNRPFLIASSDRMTTIRSLLEARRAKEAMSQLRRWRAESLAALGIQEHGSPPRITTSPMSSVSAIGDPEQQNSVPAESSSPSRLQPMALFRRRATPPQMTRADIRLNARLQPQHRVEIYERPLEILLADVAPGSEITGGGSMTSPDEGIIYCDLELSLTGDPASTIRTVIDALDAYGAPIGSWAQIGQEPKIPFGNSHGVALSLDGTSLPDEVYQQNDVNDLIAVLSQELGDEAALQSWWEGNGRTTMYFYGPDVDHITTVLSSAESRFPLAENSTITRLT